MQRAEDLRAWVCEVTEQSDSGDHLSLMLQDGQLLCLLANALDPEANLRMNKLSTAFHSKANIQSFVDWCRRIGVRDAQLFRVDDLFTGDDFEAVLQTLSLLFEKFGGLGFSDDDEDRSSMEEGPLSDRTSATSSPAQQLPDSPVMSPVHSNTSELNDADEPAKKKGKNTFTKLVTGGFFGRKKKGKKTDDEETPDSPKGTPPMSPSSPASPPPSSEAAPINNKLNNFLNQVPPPKEEPLEHIQRPSGPPKRASLKRRPTSIKNPAPPSTPPKSSTRKSVASTPPPPASPKEPVKEEKDQQVASGASDARNKFAAFMRSNPPTVKNSNVEASKPTPAASLAAFKQKIPTASSPKIPPPTSPTPEQDETPSKEPVVERKRQTSDEFAARRAAFSPKSASKTPPKGFNSNSVAPAPKPAPVSIPKSTPAPAPAPAPAPTSAPKSAPGNKLQSFLQATPPASTSSTSSKPRTESKLAAFLASTNGAPTPAATQSNAFDSTRSLSSSKSTVNSSPSSSFLKDKPPQSAPSGIPSIPVASSIAESSPSMSPKSSRFPFTPRQPIARSTGKCDYVRRRRTYFDGRERRRAHFSLEEKRSAFMDEQLAIKQEQMKQQDGGGDSKQNLIVQGVQCYVPDEKHVWLLAEVVDYNERSNKVTVDATLDSGDVEQRVIDLNDPKMIRALAGPTAKKVESLPVAIFQENPDGVDDMQLLRYLNEPSILFNLKQRFDGSHPYTYTNEIVIAVNPYKWIPDLYGDHLHDQYLHKARDTVAPHVYATSAAAYKHMTNNSVNQSILVSGESGAGKTETTKIVMNHLASVAGGRMDKTIARVIDVNPLLESFGNAKTTRNDNSSRFGKFTQLQFSESGKLIGAKCETYLLEKSRVVTIAEGERNYHIFYQLLAGLTPKEQQTCHLESSFAYKYTGALKDMSIPGLDDKEWLDGTRKSLSLVGLDEDAQKVLFGVLAGILLLGEVDFEASGEEGSKISTQDTLAHIADDFGLPTERIEQALCNRTVVTRNDAVTVPLAPVEAMENRDALAKTVYSKMFDWMVRMINDAISSDETQINGQIGILDIFGFEHFKHNSFEQFCINYANEKLQQKFTIDVFKSVEDEYIREGLSYEHIQYQDNKGIVDVIEGKLGIIALMNDHLRQPRGTEEALVNKIRTNHEKVQGKPNEHIGFPRVKRTQFLINHYAGTVTYETVGFMEKHRDTLQNDLLELITSSNIPMLTSLFDDPTATTGSGRGPKSLGSQFKVSLSSLMDNIKSTKSHYVRCIKPNSTKSPTEFDKSMVVEQLRSAGVIEAIRITRSGYPSRLTPDELAKRYCIMFPPSMHSPDVRRTCNVFMESIGRKSPVEYQMGKTLVYFRNGVMEELEAMKSDFMYYEATCIQRVVLGFIERRRLAKKIRAAIVLQSYSRMALEKHEFLFHRDAIISIQRAYRRYKSVYVPVEEEVPIEDELKIDKDEEEIDETDDDDAASDLSSVPRTRPKMERSSAFNSKSLQSASSQEEHSRHDRRSSVRRLSTLSTQAKTLLKKKRSNSINGEGTWLEEENTKLKVENRNLKYDLELMREQCIELQAIILEINKSRKR